MGIRPRGLGEREKSRQYEEEADVGERCPLVTPFSLIESDFCFEALEEEGKPDFESTD